MAPARTRKRKRAASPAPSPQDEDNELDEQPEADVYSPPNEDDEKEETDELWESFKEENHETLEQLPLSLHRTFRLIGDLDRQTQENQTQLAVLLRRYYEARKVIISDDDRVRMQVSGETGEDQIPSSQPVVSTRASHPVLTSLALTVEDWTRAADEKLNLAQSAYNAIDRHVRMLDIAIAEQEKEAAPSNPVDSPAASETQLLDDTCLPVEDTVSSRRKSTRRRPTTSRKPDQSHTLSSLASNGASSPKAIDMAVMPNEPLYCYCNQVSHGLMIACDNKNCAREWFHYACVGLSEEPTKGKSWYCPDCSEAFGRNNRRKR